MDSAKTITLDPPLVLSRAEWDRFGRSFDSNGRPYTVGSEVIYESTGEYDIELFTSKRVTLPGGVKQIYGAFTETSSFVGYSLQLSWGSQPGSEAHQILRRLSTQFNLKVAPNPIGPAWVGRFRVSQDCELEVIAKITGDGGPRSVTALVLGASNSPSQQLCPTPD